MEHVPSAFYLTILGLACIAAAPLFLFQKHEPVFCAAPLIYALFDFYKSHTSDNKLIPIAFFWFMLNFYATGMFLASGYSTEQSSTVSTNSSPSFARPAFLIISLAGLKGAAL